MNKNFPEWYRVACVEPREEQLKARWQGIEAYCGNEISSCDVLKLIRSFCKRSIDVEFRKHFIDSFYEKDNAFPQKSNLELSVLAGATLVYIINNYDGLDKLALLGLLSASFNKRKVAVPDILGVVQTEFDKRRVAIRNVAKKSTAIKSNIPQNKKLLDIVDAAKNDVNSWNAQTFSEALSVYLTNLNKLLVEAKKSIHQNVLEQKIYKEDSQVLWWMTGEWSRDTQRPFKKFKVPEACIVIGKELADIVEILPGPYASKAVLYKVLSIFSDDEIKEVTLSTAINQLDKDWREKVVNKYSTGKTKEITPLLTAVSESLKVGKASEWKSAYELLTDFDASHIKVPALELAYQMYLECLVVKSIKEND